VRCGVGRGGWGLGGLVEDKMASGAAQRNPRRALRPPLAAARPRPPTPRTFRKYWNMPTRGAAAATPPAPPPSGTGTAAARAALALAGGGAAPVAPSRGFDIPGYCGPKASRLMVWLKSRVFPENGARSWMCTEPWGAERCGGGGGEGGLGGGWAAAAESTPS
jgi:hypothetical protein